MRCALFRWRRAVAPGLSSLFTKTAPLIFATELRIVGFPADAEEITSDVYRRLWTVAGS